MRKSIILSYVLVIMSWSLSYAVDIPQNFRIVDPALPSITNPSPYFDQEFLVKRGASRTSGVAPLSVHFTAGFNRSSSTDRGFHNYEYTWDFGDPNSGIWGTNQKNKNLAKGAVSAHVYERPGTYTATLIIRDASGVVNTDTFTITVLDPDDFYSGTKTTCVSDPENNDFTGCPSGARQVSTSDLSSIASYANAGQRILFRRGSSWQTSGVNFPNNSGPVTLGAYGTCSSQDGQGICSNAPRIMVANNNFFSLERKQDWRIMDLHFVDASRSNFTFGGNIDIQRILFLGLKIDGFRVGLGWYHWNDSTPMTIDHMVVADCNISGSLEYGMFVGGERISLLGNIVKDTGTTHVSRVWQGYKGVITHNQISGSCLENGNGRHALKLGGPNPDEIGISSGNDSLQENRTEFAVVSDNVFGSSGPWPLTIGPSDAAAPTYISDILIERNRIHPDYGSQSCCSPKVQVALYIWASYVTARNNIIDGTGSSDDFTGIKVARRGVEPPPNGVEIYNNTFYRQQENAIGANIGVEILTAATNTIVMNNIARFTEGYLFDVVKNSSNGTVLGHNALLNISEFFDPNNNNPIMRDFGLRPYSSSIGSGATVPVFDNFDGNSRTVFNKGAF